jgi:hypothetical protein
VIPAGVRIPLHLSHGGGNGNVAYNVPFAWEIDLGQTIYMAQVNLVGRIGCCPDRMTNYRVTVHEDDDGSIGAEVWGADFRTDLSHIPDGGTDVITSGFDPSGTFAGQWVRISLLPGAADNYHLQLAEVEVWGSLVPEPSTWTLLAVGAVSFMPLVRRRLRSKRS